MKTNKTPKRITSSITLFFALFIVTSLVAQKTVNAKDILDDIKNGKNVSYQNVTITGTFDMTFMDGQLSELPKKHKWYNNGGSNSIQYQVEGKVSFENCVFEDNVFAYIHDEDSKYTFVANFEDDVQFKNCTFKGNALFKYSDFERSADFNGSKFKENTTFKYAKFNEAANFAGTVFEEDAIFKYSEFRRGVSFNNAKFEENLNLKYTKVNGDFDIKGMDVAYDIDSKYTKINGKGFSKHLLDSRN
jgi:hypothetical protein